MRASLRASNNVLSELDSAMAELTATNNELEITKAQLDTAKVRLEKTNKSLDTMTHARNCTLDDNQACVELFVNLECELSWVI